MVRINCAVKFKRGGTQLALFSIEVITKGFNNLFLIKCTMTSIKSMVGLLTML